MAKPPAPDKVLFPLDATAQAIYRLHEQRGQDEQPRHYLGWSAIGGACERALWYDFHWCGRPQFDGRMRRLFDTGHREEARVLDELRAIGCQVWSIDPATGQQYGCQAIGGHLRGHIDAVVLGLPEAPKTPHLVDVKTVRAKLFDKLLAAGTMEQLYPKYWAQAHGYMGELGLTRALFIFVCKDDDRLWCQRFAFDAAVHERYLEHARRIITADRPPERIGGRDWWECKFCPHLERCHGTDAPAVNCRTCTHSTPLLEGGWSCARNAGAPIPEHVQPVGCTGHRFNPYLLHWAEWVGADEQVNTVTYRHAGGEFTNGARPQGYSSAEIAACQDKRALGALLADPYVQTLREQFQAEVVG